MSKTLLLADDSLTIQRVIELSFAHEDVRVVSVSDGQRAIEWMAAEQPDIVLVDVQVPEVDGYTVAEHVKRSPTLARVPVLLLAGAFDPVDQERVSRIGCDVLVKPFEPQQLITRVKDLLNRPPADMRDTRERRAQDTETGTTVRPFPARAAHHDGPSATEPEPLEPPARPSWEQGPPAAAPPEAGTASTPKVSLANAFSALLAAEQSNPAASAAAAAPLSDAAVEEAVRRALVRMTDDLVRRLVIETAERLIKEEIDKIKAL